MCRFFLFASKLLNLYVSCVKWRFLCFFVNLENLYQPKPATPKLRPSEPEVEPQKPTIPEPKVAQIKPEPKEPKAEPAKKTPEAPKARGNALNTLTCLRMPVLLTSDLGSVHINSISSDEW